MSTLTEELEALLATPEPDQVAKEQATQELVSEEIDLDELLAESVAEANASRDLKAARARLAKGGLSRAEAEAINAKVREWEAKLEWRPEANVALFERITCRSCARNQSLFVGLFQRQSPRSASKAMRWVASRLDERLPREVAIRNRSTDICRVCAIDHGWSMSMAQEWRGEQ